MKKKLSAFIACPLCAMLLVGCGGKSISGTVKPAENTPEPTEQADSAVIADGAEDKPLSLGSIAGGIYENEYAGLGCALDPSWKIYSAEDLNDLSETVLENNDPDGSKGFGELIVDMQADNADMFASVNVGFRKMEPEQRLERLMLTEEEYVDMMSQSDIIVDGFDEAGFKTAEMEKRTVEFLGETHTMLHTKTTVSDVPCFILQYYDFSKGQYSVTVTALTLVEDRTQEVMSLFYKLEK